MACGSIIISNEITDFLKCDIGVRSKDYKDENAYLNGILKFVQKIRNNQKAYLDSWNLWEELDLSFFKKGIEFLEKHILKTIETPIDKRGNNFHY
jgi:hypothetical protein